MPDESIVFEGRNIEVNDPAERAVLSALYRHTGIIDPYDKTARDMFDSGTNAIRIGI